jgi:hypothetical protein
MSRHIALRIAPVSSSPDRENRNLPAENFAANEPPQPAIPTESGLLREVLQHTTEIGGPGRPLERRESEALAAVARRYRGQSLDVEPVATELVGAMLIALFPPSPNSADQRAAVARHVAQTLLEDPRCQERLAAIWKRCCEEEM